MCQKNQFCKQHSKNVFRQELSKDAKSRRGKFDEEQNINQPGLKLSPHKLSNHKRKKMGTLQWRNWTTSYPSDQINITNNRQWDILGVWM